MARPRRPAAEVEAVREAAQLFRSDKMRRSDAMIARKLAVRVVEAMLRDLEQTDPLVRALWSMEQKLTKCPIRTLATCPEINTLGSFIERRVERLHARAGRYLNLNEQTTEKAAIIAEISSTLAGRYARHLRS